MTTATHVATVATSLTVDPARWGENLINTYGYAVHQQSMAEREVVATVSAIIKDGRPVIARHNSEGRWAVKIDESTGRYVTLIWSSYTLDESTGSLRYITRGEAVMVMCHEMFHVLFTDEITRPSWCKPEHWAAFFTCVNFAEDVRIEDLGESVVPVFSLLRRVENDRMMHPNATNYGNFDLVRQVMIVLYAERCCTTASMFDGLPDATVQGIIDNGRASFTDATNAGDTATLVERLRPLYDLIAPHLTGGGGGGTGGDPGEDEGEPGRGGTPGNPGEDEGEPGGDGEPGGTPGGGGNGEQKEDASGDEQEDGDGEDGGSGASAERNDQDDADSDTMRPDRQRGRWQEDRQDTPITYGDEDKTINGDEIMVRFRTRKWTDDTSASQRMMPVTRMVVRHLRRTLQDNANGGWIGRRKRGSFDAASAKRLGIGDLRAFRRRQGPKGALDFSLVLCLDASGSVGGYVGQNIADAGLAVYEAAQQINGLDVALCVYGSGVQVGIPFGTNMDTAKSRNAYQRGLRCIRGGTGGGTMEADALAWARAASRKRGAEGKLIIVITDGQPYAEEDVSEQVAVAMREGIVTGGIGIGFVDPDYHTYHQRVQSASEVPGALATLVRTMMRAK